MTKAQVVEIFADEGLPLSMISTPWGLDATYWEGDGLACIVFLQTKGAVTLQWQEEGFTSATRQQLTRIHGGMVLHDAHNVFGREADDQEASFATWRDIDGEARVYFEHEKVAKLEWFVGWRDEFDVFLSKKSGTLNVPPFWRNVLWFFRL